MSNTAFELDVNDAAVRKWGKLQIGISDYGDAQIAIPTKDALFDPETHKPNLFPDGVKDMGYITPAGVVLPRSVSSTPAMMLQSSRPVRNDLESVDDSLTIQFGETNGWTRAMREGLPVSEWPDDKDAAFAFDGQDLVVMPLYVLWIRGVDGAGASARYRYEIFLRTQITGMEDRTMNKADPEIYGFTFSVTVDPVTGKPYVMGEDGPGYTSHLPAPDPEIPAG